jgi:hypothetical protein
MKALNLKTFEVEFGEGLFSSWRRGCLQVALDRVIYLTAINTD